jgi:hypothetical protein
MTDLGTTQLLEGFLGFIWVAIAIFIGVRIIFKAKELDRKELITVGLSYIFVSSAWWGVAVQLISYGIFSFPITYIPYLLIANIFVPPGLVCWVYSFSEMVNPYLKKKLLLIYVPFCILWEVLIFIFLFTNPDFVGSFEFPFNSSHGDVIRIFIIIAIFSFVLSGVYFAMQSMKLEDPEIKWKGRFLFAAWISFCIGALMDALLPLIPVILILTRLILITGAIEYYLGFFLPSKFKEWLLQ